MIKQKQIKGENTMVHLKKINRLLDSFKLLLGSTDTKNYYQIARRLSAAVTSEVGKYKQSKKKKELFREIMDLFIEKLPCIESLDDDMHDDPNEMITLIVTPNFADYKAGIWFKFFIDGSAQRNFMKIGVETTNINMHIGISDILLNILWLCQKDSAAVQNYKKKNDILAKPFIEQISYHNYYYVETFAFLEG